MTPRQPPAPPAPPSSALDRDRATPAGRQRVLRRLAWGAFAVIVVALAVARARHQQPGTDFSVFWHAGDDFAHGRPLYSPQPGERTFIYPPFAAQVFQLFSLFPLKFAAGMFYLASVALFLLAIRLTRDLVTRLDPDRPPAAPALVIAVACSAQFVLNNLNLLQVNLVTFVLCLAGVRAVVSGRPGGALWLVVAAAWKIAPVFFVVWAALRGGRRVAGITAATALACLLLPIAQRGLTVGIDDLVSYYDTFLRQFASGSVVTDYTNQNLAAMIYRALTVTETPDGYAYAYLSGLQPVAPAVYRISALLLLAWFLGRLLWLARRRRRITALEIASVFLTAHLLSGITWKAHMVTMLYVFYVFLGIDRRPFGAARRLTLWAAWAGIAVVGLTGRDLVGDAVHHYLGGYSVYAWLMLWLLALTVILDLAPAQRNGCRAGSGPACPSAPAVRFSSPP